jgi:hypothetical protein
VEQYEPRPMAVQSLLLVPLVANHDFV